MNKKTKETLFSFCRGRRGTPRTVWTNPGLLYITIPDNQQVVLHWNKYHHDGTHILFGVTCIKEHSYVVCFFACYHQITTTDLYSNNQVNLPCLVLGLPSWGQAYLKPVNSLFFHLLQIVKVCCKRCVLCKSHWSKCVYTWKLNYYAGMEYYISQLADICFAAVVQHFVDPPKPAPFHDEVFTFSCGICHIPIAGSVHIWHGPYRCWTTRRGGECEPASDRFHQDPRIAMWTSLYQGNAFHLVYMPEVCLTDNKPVWSVVMSHNCPLLLSGETCYCLVWWKVVLAKIRFLLKNIRHCW